MLPSFLLSLREGLEAALILGIVLGTLRKMGSAGLSRPVWLGAGTAAFASALAAGALMLLGAELEGRAEKIFEGVTMLLAAGMLTWMIFWMQRHSRALKSSLESGVRATLDQPGRSGLFALAFLAVVREGIELALFLGAASVQAGALGTLAGALLGLAGAAVLGWLLFASTVSLNLRQFFAITNVLLMLFAAGLVGHGAHELVEAGLLPALRAPLWDIGALLGEETVAGQVLKSLFGYNSDPALIEVLIYAGYLGLVALAAWLQRAPQPRLEQA